MPEPEPTHDPGELTRHIEARFHRPQGEQLPELAALAAKVEQAHAGSPDLPVGLAGLLHRMTGELAVHMKKEELILFPAIRRGGSPRLDGPIAAMRADHDGHLADIARIRAMTGNLALPEGACPTWTALYDGLAHFTVDLEAHIRLENDVLFPHFETATTEIPQ